MPASHATNGDADETTPLNGAAHFGNMGTLRSHSHSKPWSEDSRAFVRWPANFFRLTWLTLASNYVNVLLVFVPVGIVLGALDLNPTAAEPCFTASSAYST